MQYAYPDNDLSYEGNFLNMMFKTTELKYTPNPVLERALTVLFILHADHEQNCSTNAMRSIGSAQTDPFSSLAGAAAALYGPLHGGANEMVLRMLKEIGSVDKVPDYIKRVKAGEFRLMGFGHRVYKNYDPRARIIKQVADEVFEVTGKDPMLDVALELERIALQLQRHIQHRILSRNFKHFIGNLLDDARAGIVVFINAVTEAHQTKLTGLHPLYVVWNFINGTNLLQHAQHHLVGAAVQWTIKRSRRAG